MTSVSIAIPSHNHWAFLDECLASVLAQTHADWEAIVVDDGSTAPGFEAARARWSDPRIRWLSHEKSRGPGPARNTAIRAARHPYIAVLDSDDMLAPDYLSTLLPRLEADPQLDCIYPHFEFFGHENRVRAFHDFALGELAQWQHMPAQVLMRKSLWERIGGFCEDPALRAGNEDWDFWIGAAEAGFRWEQYPEPLYRYRTQKTSLTTKLRAVDHLTREVIYRRHSAFIDRHFSRREFLGTGYWRSADAACVNHLRLRSLWLAARAMCLWPDAPRARDLVRRNLTSFRTGASLPQITPAHG